MFNSTEKLLMLKFLGYSPTPETRIMLNTTLALMVGADVDMENEIKESLRELVKIQDDFNGARLGAGRSFSSGGASTTQYFRGDRLNELRQHARQHVNYLSNMTGMQIISDVFAASVSRGSNHGQVIRG